MEGGIEGQPTLHSLFLVTPDISCHMQLCRPPWPGPGLRAWPAFADFFQCLCPQTANDPPPVPLCFLRAATLEVAQAGVAKLTCYNNLSRGIAPLTARNMEAQGELARSNPGSVVPKMAPPAISLLWLPSARKGTEA